MCSRIYRVDCNELNNFQAARLSSYFFPAQLLAQFTSFLIPFWTQPPLESTSPSGLSAPESRFISLNCEVLINYSWGSCRELVYRLTDSRPLLLLDIDSNLFLQLLFGNDHFYRSTISFQYSNTQQQQHIIL